MGKLTLAIPSKGRLQEQVEFLFRRCRHGGEEVRRSRISCGDLRTCRYRCDAVVSVRDRRRASGWRCAFWDHWRGSDPGSGAGYKNRVTLLKPLGFGFANVVVAVPQAWIDVSTMADLDDVCAAFAQRHGKRLRVATKYTQLTRSFFAEHGILDYRIVESAGATEGAPAAGAAEAIVDITTTGATLAANGLKIISDGMISESQAQLAASIGADWDETSRAAAHALLARLAARDKARSSFVLRVRLEARADALVTAMMRAAAVTVLAKPSAADVVGEFSLLCARSRLSAAVDALRAAGFDAAVTAQEVDYVFDQQDPLTSALNAALRP